ncbi:MAG: hypothetical protein Q9169_004122 [Polycauliona sp. 2 TL-2023]
MLTKDRIKRNATSSPLLTLPAELRDRIWTEVLGSRLIHIEYHRSLPYNGTDQDSSDSNSDSDSESSIDDEPTAPKDNTNRFKDNPLPKHNRRYWRHTICQHDCPETQSPRKVVTQQAMGVKSSIRVSAHADCILPHHLLYSTSASNPSGPWTIHLTLLRASRQIYLETNRIVWTTNTFSFREGTALSNFLTARTLHQKRLLQNLRFETRWGSNGEETDWNTALTMPVVKSLTSLRTLRIHITADIRKEIWDLNKDRFVRLTTFTEGLRKLSILPLRSVEVAVNGTAADNYVFPQWTWPLWNAQDRKQCAEDLKALLLNPDGAKEYVSRVTVASRKAVSEKWFIP